MVGTEIQDDWLRKKKILNDMTSCSFGEILKAFRCRRRLTQQQLADRLGVRRNTVGGWERGDGLPSSKTMVLELARLLLLDQQESRLLLEASLTALSPYFLVPLPRNPFFTGRAELLEALHRQLSASQAVALTQSLALQGLGGVGKTQIALEYAYRYALHYSAIFWIGAKTRESISSGLLALAEGLNLPEFTQANPRRVQAAVLRWLSTHKDWLLIWDNVEDIELFSQFVPPTRQGAMLLTTRRQALGTLAVGLEMKAMTQEEGLLLLLRRAKLVEPDAGVEQMHQFAMRVPSQYAAAEKLVDAMGRLPLALDQAGAYIEETGCCMASYLHLYEQQRGQLLARRGTPTGAHPHSVVDTLLLSCQQIEEQHVAAMDLLRCCAFVAPDAIPEELFGEGSAHLGSQLEPLAADPSQLDLALGTLRTFSLVQRQPETQTLSLHRLVQEVLRDQMGEQKQSLWRGRVLKALNAIFPDVVPETSRACARLLPHALACVNSTPDSSGDQELAQLLHKAAVYLSDETHQYQQALALFQRAVRLWQQAEGPESLQASSSFLGLALLFRTKGQYQRAEAFFQQALSIRQQALGPTHPEVAHVLYGLASLFLKQGQYQRAEALYRRALSIQQQALGPTHPKVANLLNDLAFLCYQQGDYEQAQRLAGQALLILKESVGPDHAFVNYVLDTLATVSCAQGHYEQAEALYQRALCICEERHEQDHSNVAYALIQLGGLYLKQGSYQQAWPLFERAVQLLEEIMGPEHPWLASALNGLATLSREEGRDEEAQRLYEQALRIREQQLGLSHPETAQTLHDLAVFHLKQGSYEQAESLILRALALREQQLGDSHPDTARSWLTLARLLQQQGEGERAESLYQQALPVLEARLGKEHPEMVKTRNEYQQVLAQKSGLIERPCEKLPECSQDEAGQAVSTRPTIEQVRAILKAHGWSLHLKTRRNKPYAYATRRIGKRTQSRYLAPLSGLVACLAAAEALPNAQEQPSER